MSASPRHLREILADSSARYAQVTPDGIRLGDKPPCPVARVQVASVGDARTLYRGRSPVCRSLDGLRSITDACRQCAACLDRKHCTPQLRLDFYADRALWRLLLAHTSARNLALYLAELQRRGATIDRVDTRLHVRDRGHWGELRFAQIRASST